MTKTTLLSLSLLLVAACSGAEETAKPDDSIIQDDLVESDLSPPGDDGTLGSDAVMQGEWVEKPIAGAPAALFGPPESEAVFTVRCEGNVLGFDRAVLVDGGGQVDMALMAGGESRNVTAAALSGPLPRVTGTLPANDPFAEVLAGTNQTIAVSVDGGPAFTMPASPIMRGVVSNCGS